LVVCRSHRRLCLKLEGSRIQELTSRTTGRWIRKALGMT